MDPTALKGIYILDLVFNLMPLGTTWPKPNQYGQEYKMSRPDQLSGLVQIHFFSWIFFNLDHKVCTLCPDLELTFSRVDKDTDVWL